MLMRSKGKVRRGELEMVKKKKKKVGGLEEYSGRGKGETGAAGDVKVNYHITGHCAADFQEYLHLRVEDWCKVQRGGRKCETGNHLWSHEMEALRGSDSEMFK